MRMTDPMPRARVIFLLLLTGACAVPARATAQTRRLALDFDTTAAAAALAILEREQGGAPVPDEAWTRLFSTPGYARLKEREAAMRRDFTDSSFVDFIRSDTLIARTPALRRTLDQWARTDVEGAARRALAYLPDDARITATVYIMIKPKPNSFVWDLARDPAIFLYLDPALSAPEFENTVAHELHHIGLASVSARADSLAARLPERARLAAGWMRAFGEGFAMLAAAGGTEVHPHIASPDSTRARWDSTMGHFNRDLDTLAAFFGKILSGELHPDSVRAVASTFYGIQGPWYTVGWKMAVTIEERFGHAELVRCITDPRRLLMRYNAAAAERNWSRGEALALWPRELIAALDPGRADAPRRP